MDGCSSTSSDVPVLYWLRYGELENVKQGVAASLTLTTLLLCAAAMVKAADVTHIEIAYLAFEKPPTAVLSNVLPEPANAGLAGAQLAIDDNNTTGKFLNQKYSLLSHSSPSLDDLQAKALEWVGDGIDFIVVNMPSEQLQALSATLQNQEVLIFNAGSRDNKLRSDICLPNVLHTRPSDAMLADALGQWFISRKQKEWFLISGSQAADIAFANSIRRTALRFGIKLIGDKTWSFDTDLRRTAAKELPIFTRADDYDAVIVADIAGDFGEFVLHNTWLPRPVAGTQGLTALTWHRVVEQWGAAQLQSRFEKRHNRWMNSADYAAWIAARAVAEAVTRISKTDQKSVQSYITSEDFELAGFKGRALSFRPWSGQLRQPIPLIHPRALVAQAPLEGFLHPRNDLDTLGIDERESQCRIVSP